MRRQILSGLLSISLLLGRATPVAGGVAFAAPEPLRGPEGESLSADESGLKISYLRFDIYIGENYTGLVCSSPNEGEDFYRFPGSVDSPEELKDLRVEMSYGISDLSPEDAILQVMTGNPAEEHQLLTLDFIPEYGRIYDMKLVSDGADGWLLVPAEEE